MTPRLITKEEREARKRGESMRGLGDVVAKVTTALGIPPCGGCKQRQAFLNKVVPFGTRQSKTQH